ncbi:MAG TPA: hypothetical protein VKV04_13535 [Verrucomicrobiae bacterium]|nr:hypothetical protein [Verrucomicrobiae bacterium]
MGLSIEVGLVADLLVNDEEGAEEIQQQFAELSRYLTSIGLQPHVDPPDVEVWSGDMFGYSGLHYLRRLAAHLHYTQKLPEPGDDDSADDPVLQRYYNDYNDAPAGKAFGAYDHLIVHSDAEGYYLPQDFECVIIPGDSCPVVDMVGSSQRLRAECEKIAAALQLPLDLDPEDERLIEAAESQGEGGGATAWERYGIESYSCLQLHRAACHSISTRAAIVFT